MEVQYLPHPPTGDAPLWDSYTTWKPNWNVKSPPNCKSPYSKTWTTTNPSATVAAWPGIAITATPGHCRQLRRSPPPNIRVPLRPVSPYGRRYDAAGRRNAPPAVFQKNRDIAISLAAPGLSYARAGNWVGCVKSTVCKWLQKAPLAAAQLPPDGTLELDGLWTRTRRGRPNEGNPRCCGDGVGRFWFLGGGGSD